MLIPDGQEKGPFVDRIQALKASTLRVLVIIDHFLQGRIVSTCVPRANPFPLDIKIKLLSLDIT